MAEDKNQEPARLAQMLNIDAGQVAAILLTGYRLYEQGRLEDARTLFEGLAIIDGANPYVHSILGAIYQKERRYELSLQRYDMALNLFPEDPNALTNRGETYLKLGKFQEAATDFKKALELDPNGKHPSVNRARLLVSLAQQALLLARDKGLETVRQEAARWIGA
jgi:tetratricopeptide (TPR) repeat protein